MRLLAGRRAGKIRRWAQDAGVLVVLDRQTSGAGPKKLAGKLNIPAATVTESLARLEKQGYVAKGDDGRYRVASKGRAALDGKLGSRIRREE